MEGPQALPLVDTPQAHITPEQSQIRRIFRTPGGCCACAQEIACRFAMSAIVSPITCIECRMYLPSTWCHVLNSRRICKTLVHYTATEQLCWDQCELAAMLLLSADRTPVMYAERELQHAIGSPLSPPQRPALSDGAPFTAAAALMLRSPGTRHSPLSPRSR